MSSNPETWQEAVPTLAELLDRAFWTKMVGVNTAIPGVVDKYDQETNTAEVKVGIKAKFLGEDYSDLPLIADVPVIMPRSAGGSAFIKLPIKVGDTGVLIFSQKSISDWLASSSKSVLPTSKRRFDISDGMFIPGLMQNSKAGLPKGDDLRIVYGEMSIIVHPSGKIEFKGQSEDFMSLFVDFIQEMIDAKVVTSLGASPFTAGTILKLTQLKAKANTLKK
jgi:hypothetical protein